MRHIGGAIRWLAILALFVVACMERIPEQEPLATATHTAGPLPTKGLEVSVVPSAALPAVPTHVPTIDAPEDNSRDTNAQGPVPIGRARTQEEIVALAHAHLAAWLGVAVEEIEVVAVEQVVWEEPPADFPPPPAKVPDRAFLPRLAGYRILLEADGVVYEYQQLGRWLRFCGALDGQGRR